MTTPSALDASATRRQLLRTSGIAAATAAFLAACGTKSDSKAGSSGLDPTTTAVAPTVPVGEPSEADLTQQTTTLRTATSLELLAAQLYANYGASIADPAWNTEALRFGTDHAAAATMFTDELPADDQVTEPNAYIQENSVDPVADGLTNDAAILDFFAAIESAIAATYVTAVATVTTSDLRAMFAANAASAARRNALMGSRGQGTVPTSPLFPTTDLISNDAYVPVDSGEAAAN